jgi:predicted site-specific integrase-resolvase
VADDKKKDLDPRIKRNWEEIQKRYTYPVNAIGVRIDAKDKETLRVWRDNGIDKFMKQ